MIMKLLLGIPYNPLKYETPWRRNYESLAMIFWLVSAPLTWLLGQWYFQMPELPFRLMALTQLVMGFCWAIPAIRLWRLQQGLRGQPLSFVSLNALQALWRKQPDLVWLGYGFVFENSHAQRVYDLLKLDLSLILPPRRKGNEIGYPWIHGVEPKEQPVYQPLKQLEGHTLVVGTPGSGKTRLLDLLITQAILRQDPVVIIDPKGDHDLREKTRLACAALGQSERFVQFNPAEPEHSIRIDSLSNNTRVTEIASRLAALIPSEGPGNPFKSFGWLVLNNIAQGLVIVHQHPTLVLLRRYLEGGTEQLVVMTLEAYLEHLGDDWSDRGRQNLASLQNQDEEADKKFTPARKAKALIAFYREHVQPLHPKPELEGLLSMFEHDHTHFSKMVASLLPIMNMLTSGHLKALLSPSGPEEARDNRVLTHFAELIKNRRVVYVALDSLSDGIVGSAIGSLFLSDLTAVAGSRYNFDQNASPVSLYVDEAAEVVNDPFIQMLNKGRGAGFQLTIATQTFADFSARLGSRDKALQVLGNLNNRIALRVTDEETQNYVARSLPKTRIKSILHSQGQNLSASQPGMQSGSLGERLMEEEMELFPPPLLGTLPNLEYLAQLGGQVIKGRLPILTAAPADAADRSGDRS